ncbi:MAG: 16S rRNA (cytidine(1402)-2'-O)-methyltransferase [Oscillospiraceae bacterium]|nr:16S rRNA (cytidine(1402)-2'-O)-methyltransferase [Oscillospiraceae bacterium]MCD8376476.1 16S rRNA (cytidine(1402)-2'-O)-methyltransferase [Oscillospiraceae bacterium]
MAGRLYLVPTPIGNLGDLSARAAEALAGADFIAAEDTRVSLKLLNHLGLKKPLTSYHRHNCADAGPAILRRVLDGQTCALVTDAGTPAVSDPGQELVALCVQNGVEVISLPGPCALITALTVSGLPTGRFTFEGFLPTNKKNRQAQLESLLGETRTMIFYEAPHKLRATLEDLAAAFGPERRAALCRELTKLHEEIYRATLGQALERYDQQEPRGEFVLVVEGAAPAAPEEVSPELALARVSRLRRQGLGLNQAVKAAAQELRMPKNQLYSLALEAENQEE